MISRLNGRLIEKNPTDLLIECAGVGYEVKISLNTYSVLPNQEAIILYTKQIIREDAHMLYGFASKDEREMFTHLISVSGIGPNTAIIMLSSMTPDEIAQAIRFLVENPEKAAEMGENGRKMVQNTYNWTAEEKKMLAFYQKVLVS